MILIDEQQHPVNHERLRCCECKAKRARGKRRVLLQLWTDRRWPRGRAKAGVSDGADYQGWVWMMNRHERRKQNALTRRKKRWDKRVDEEVLRLFEHADGLVVPPKLLARMRAYAETMLCRRTKRKPPVRVA